MENQSSSLKQVNKNNLCMISAIMYIIDIKILSSDYL